MPLVLAQALAPLSAAADEPGVARPAAEEPALARRVPPQPAAGFWRTRERGPRLKLAYRTFTVAEMGDVTSRYNCFTIDVFLYSGYLRGGLGVEGGADSTPRDNFILEGSFSLGAQYPARITPFVDFNMGFGFLRRDILQENLFGFSYHAGVDAGAELFIISRFLVSAAVGWRRQVFRFGESPDVEATYVYFDSFSVKVGLGF